MSIANKMMTSAREQTWYVAQVQPNRENLALTHLHRQGFKAISPSRTLLRTVRGKTIEVKKSLFPGYLFTSLDLERDRWRSINGTIGVLRLVGFSGHGRPAPLPPGFVESLDQDGKKSRADYDPIGVGSNVRVLGGPFDDLCGVLATSSDNDRVTILLSLLGKETRVTIARRSLIAA